MKNENLTAAYCGLYCDSCGKYIGTTENPVLLKEMAAMKGTSAEDQRCLGCRSDTLSEYCRTCAIKSCIEERGLDFCSQCDEYPCDILKEFQTKAPHRIELYESLAYAKENGFEKWYEKMEQDYSCTECGTINSAYDLSCRKCGARPSNAYVARNEQAIKANIRQRKRK